MKRLRFVSGPYKFINSYYLTTSEVNGNLQKNGKVYIAQYTEILITYLNWRQVQIAKGLLHMYLLRLFTQFTPLDQLSISFSTR